MALQRAAWVDVLAEASTRFHDGMRAAGLEVKLGDLKLQATSSHFNVQIDTVGQVRSLADSIDELVAECQRRRWQRFYPLPMCDPSDGLQYCSAIGPLRLMVTFEAESGLTATFDVLGREA